MRLIDLSSNQMIEQPTEVAEKLLRAGTHTVNANDDFFMIDPLTERKERVSGRDLFTALDIGKRFVPDSMIKQSQEEEAYDDADIRATALSVLRGASAGLSDQFLVRGLGVKPETLSRLKKYNPYLDMIGQTVGAIAPMVAPALAATRLGTAAKTVAELGKYTAGPAIARAGLNTERVVANAVRGATEGQRGRIADAFVRYGSKTAGSAVEGMFYGAGQFISENALGNPEATGENLFAKGAKFAGEGALIGGALALGTQGVFDAAGTFVKALDTKMPKVIRAYLGVDEETTMRYLKNSEYYDKKTHTVDSIAKELNHVAKVTRGKLDRGQIDIDDIESQVKLLKEEAIERKSNSVQIYRGLERELKEWRKAESRRLAETPIPVGIVDDIEFSKERLKEIVLEDDASIDKILDSVPQDIGVVKTKNLISKLQRLKSSFFTKSKTQKGVYLPVSMEEKAGLNVIDEYIEMTKNYAEGGYETLTLKEFRDYLKKIRKDVNFVGPSNFHSDKIDALLNLYQGYVKTAIQKRAPMEFEVIMENLRRNREVLSFLNRKLYDPEKIQSFVSQYAKETPTSKHIGHYIEKMDTETGYNILPVLDQYKDIIRQGTRPTAEEITLMETQAPFFKEYLERGLEAEGLQKYPAQQLERIGGIDDYNQIKLDMGVYAPLAFRTQEEMARAAAQKGEFAILNKYKGALPEDADAYINRLIDGLDRQKEISSLLDKKNLKRTEVLALEAEMKKLKKFEDFDHAAKLIDQATSKNHRDIKDLYGKLAKIGDDDLVEAIEYLKVNNSFEKAFPGKSSRNVNLWGLALGGGLGTFGGGFIGGALGAIVGGFLDYYGPATAKNILKGWSNVRGNLTVQKIYKVINDEIPEMQKQYNDISLGALKAAEDANKEIESKVLKAPTDYIRRTVVPTVIREDDVDYDDNREKAEEWIRSKDEVIENFYQDNDIFWQVAPQTVSSYFKTYQRAVEFIDTKIPRGSNDYFDEYEPSNNEKYRFNKYMSYIENPTRFFKEMSDGYISSEGVEVIKSVYPNMFNSLSDSIMKSVERDGVKDMPIQKRIEIKSKLGIDLIPAVTQQTFAMLQQKTQPTEDINKVNSKVSNRTQTDLLRISNKA